MGLLYTVLHAMMELNDLLVCTRHIRKQCVEQVSKKTYFTVDLIWWSLLRLTVSFDKLHAICMLNAIGYLYRAQSFITLYDLIDLSLAHETRPNHTI